MNNSITVVGRIGQVPSSISFEDTGKQLVKFSVAVKEFSPNTDEEKTLWFDVNAWNGLGERALKTITKGREVVLNGRLGLSNYKKEINGVEVELTKPVIKLTSFHLCGKRPTEDEMQPEDQAPAKKTRAAKS